MIQIENAVKRFGKLILTELKEENINCWVAGGAVRDYFLGLPVTSDIDLFFPDERNYNLAVSYFDEAGAKTIWESDNGMKVELDGKTFDLVKKFFLSPQATIEAFDFTVSMFAVDLKTVYTAPTSFIDLAKKQLMVNKITFPASSMSRAFKYHRKGFWICQGEQRKLIEAVQAMPKIVNDLPIADADGEVSGDNLFRGID